jgi:hypothetical protein
MQAASRPRPYSANLSNVSTAPHKTSEHNIFVEKLGNANGLQSALLAFACWQTYKVENPKADCLTAFSLDQDDPASRALIKGQFPDSGGTL